MSDESDSGETDGVAPTDESPDPDEIADFREGGSARNDDEPRRDGVDVQALIDEVKTGEGEEADQQGDGRHRDPLFEKYRKLLARVQGLPELPMRAAHVESIVGELEPDEVVWCLDQMIRGTLWGRSGAMEAMMATVWWLIELRERDDYDRIKNYFETAHDLERPAVLDLFREVPPKQALVDGQELPEVRMPQDRDVTLGERRSLAAGPKRRILERLLMDPDPLVIGKLLDNPQIRLEDVREIATRRPTTPEILREVVSHPRWFTRFGAREAIVRNPYADTGLVLKLLPTMGIKSLRRIAMAGDLHDLVRESAERLVELREERTAPLRV